MIGCFSILCMYLFVDLPRSTSTSRDCNQRKPVGFLNNFETICTHRLSANLAAECEGKGSIFNPDTYFRNISIVMNPALINDTFKLVRIRSVIFSTKFNHIECSVRWLVSKKTECKVRGSLGFFPRSLMLYRKFFEEFDRFLNWIKQLYISMGSSRWPLRGRFRQSVFQ